MSVGVFVLGFLLILLLCWCCHAFCCCCLLACHLPSCAVWAWICKPLLQLFNLYASIVLVVGFYLMWICVINFRPSPLIANMANWKWHGCFISFILYSLTLLITIFRIIKQILIAWLIFIIVWLGVWKPH